MERVAMAKSMARRRSIGVRGPGSSQSVSTADSHEQLSTLSGGDQAIAAVRHFASQGVMSKLRAACDSIGDSCIDTAGTGGQTALHRAAGRGHLDAVKLLVEGFGAQVNLPDAGGRASLFWACSHGGRVELVRYLLQQGAEVNMRTRDGWTALHECANNGLVKEASVLIRTNANLDTPSADGWSPVMTAASNGYVEMAELLLKSGANNKQQNDEGMALLHVCASRNYHSLVKAALDRGADPNARTKQGWTPLMSACSKDKGHVEAVKVLALAPGTDIDAAKADGATALHIAVASGHGKVVDRLLRLGANPDLCKKNGNSPLMTALDKMNFDMVRTLLPYVDVNIANQKGKTPLVLACEKALFGAVRLLLEAGAKIGPKELKAAKTSVDVDNLVQFAKSSNLVQCLRQIRLDQHMTRFYDEGLLSLGDCRNLNTKDLAAMGVADAAEALAICHTVQNRLANRRGSGLTYAVHENSVGVAKIMLSAGEEVQAKHLTAARGSEEMLELLNFYKSSNLVSGLASVGCLRFVSLLYDAGMRTVRDCKSLNDVELQDFGVKSHVARQRILAKVSTYKRISATRRLSKVLSRLSLSLPKEVRPEQLSWRAG